MNFDWAVIFSNAKFLLLQGLVGIGAYGGGTLRLAIPAILLGFVVGIILGLARLANRPWIHYPAVFYIELIRGVPLVIVIFWFWFLVPVMIGRPVPEYWVALTAFVMFEGAYIGEIIRAGIQSVPKGQVEAATASGLNYVQMMYRCDPAPGHPEYDPCAGHPVYRPLQGHLPGLHHRHDGSDKGGSDRQRKGIAPF